MNLNHFYHYYKSKSGGVSNLLLGSEELDQSDQGEWVRYNMNAVNANVSGVANPLSSDETVEQLDFEASTVARIAQTVTLTAGTEYTFSVWARAASGTENFRLRYWDNVGGSGGGSAFTASATWSASTGRYEMTFTAANSGTFQMFIQNAGGTAVSRRIYFWGAMLNVGGSALDYVKTEFPAGPSNPPTAPMEFGDNFAGVTAYYSLRRFTKGEDNNAIRVRRSSDDTEQDIGFDANGDLDSTALLAFVNEDYNTFLSDFANTDSISEIGGTGAINQSIGGRTGLYKFTYTGGATAHQGFLAAKHPDANNTYSVSFSIYFDTGQACNGFSYLKPDGTSDTNHNLTQGVWHSFSYTDIDGGGNLSRFIPSVNGSGNTDDDGANFYLDTWTITQTTADGAVTTFYDQTGNGNDATNSTESEQPLVVSAGTLVEENGKAAVEYDGAGDQLALSSSISLGDSDFAINLVYRSLLTSSEDYVLFGQSGQSRMRLYDYQVRLYISNVTYDFASSNNFGSQYLYTLEADAARGLQVYRDGTATGSELTIASGDDFVQEFIGNGVTRPINGRLQEVIIFNSDQSSNRTGIETNINDHFDIYT